VIAMLDIGKTNKKCFVFDEDYRIVFEKTTALPETTDEDGYPCEDLELLKDWILDAIAGILNDGRFQIRAVNMTTYGASFVYLDEHGETLTPLCNYLKPFPEALQKQFFDTYGGQAKIALETASPVLGNLNSGLQLYRLKHQKPLIFNRIKYAVHLPQYISWLVGAAKSGDDLKSSPDLAASEITSIGCHTMLWDFQKNDYHDWVKSEGIAEQFPPIRPSNSAILITNDQSTHLHVGVGLHDSSAALIPYIACFEEPFVLISTGTWCISLNPFNQEPLTAEELVQDCLCYLSYEGKPVKAARYFGGHEHELAVKKIALEYDIPENFYKNIQTQAASAAKTAYLNFMRQLVEKQAVSTRLVIGNSPVHRIFVDGGFSSNELYMTLLAAVFPEIDVFAAEIAQATALGAAMSIHHFWNKRPMPKNLILLKKIRV